MEKTRNYKWPILLMLAILITVLPASAADVGQSISEDTQWLEAVTLTENLTVSENVTLTIGANVTVSGNVTISGGGTIRRGENYTGALFTVPSDSSLTITHITIDGGAEYGAADDSPQEACVGFAWYADDNGNDAVSGIQAQDSLIRVEGGSLLMADEATLQNNYLKPGTSNRYKDGTDNTFGAGVAVSAGGSFEMDGGTITRMWASGGSAVYCEGGSTFTMNGGEITKNVSGYGGGGGAAVQIYSASATMNGGEISYNTSRNNVAVAIQGDDPLFTMNGGEICYNYGVEDSYGTIMATGATGDGTLRTRLLGGKIHHNKGYVGTAIVTYGKADTVIGGDCEIYENNGNATHGSNVVYVSDSVGVMTIGGNASIHDNNMINIVGVTQGAKLYFKENASIYNNVTETTNGCAGISLSGASTLYMSGNASIYDNISKGGATAGIHIGTDSSVKAYLSGGTITGNKTYWTEGGNSYPGSGIYLRSESAELHLSGSIAVYGNIAAKVVDYSTLKPQTYPEDFDGYGDFAGKDKVVDSDILINVAHQTAEHGKCYIADALTTDCYIGITPGNVGISADEEPLDIISGYNDYKITSQDFNKLVFNGTYTNADHAMYLNEEKNTIYRTNNRGGSENQAIQIILNANFGDSAETVEQSLTPGEETLLIPAPFAREGYTFTGWSTQADGGGTSYADQGAITVNNGGEPVTLYAQWKLVGENELIVAADCNHAEYGTAITLAASPAVEGWTYTWYKGNEPVSGQNGSTLVLENVSDSGSYHVAAGSLTSAPVTVTITAKKLETPALEQVINNSETQVTVLPPALPEGAADAEYSLDGTTWQNSPVFTGLTAATQYTAYCRFAADNSGNYTGSDIDSFTFTTAGDPPTPVITNPTYTITNPTVTGGTVTVSPRSASRGRLVTITVTPDEGYELASLTVTDSRGNTVTLTDAGNGRYTFTMPGSRVVVNASFQVEALPFTDVAEGAWYYDAVAYVYRNGLMAGVSSTQFAPDSTLNRATLATILWRLAGEPVVNYVLPFEDVAEGEWYSEAIRWAASTGIVNGTTPTTFRPFNSVTREQMAAMVHRYAEYMGYDTTASTDLGAFTDAASVNSYAAEPMGWCVAEGLISGIGTEIRPQSSATRAQIATMLMRLSEDIAE